MCLKKFNFKTLQKHFQKNPSHSIYIKISTAEIRCFECEYEICDDLIFGETSQENYLFQIRKLLLENQENSFNKLENIYENGNQQNVLLSSVLLLSQLKQINKIFQKPLLRTDLTGFHQKIHSSFISDLSRLFNSIEYDQDVENFFTKFYFSLLRKSDKFGSYQNLNLQNCFLDLIQISHNELKRRIDFSQKIKDSIYEFYDFRYPSKMDVSEFSTNFSGKIRIEKKCAACQKSSFINQDFFQIQFEEIEKNQKHKILKNRQNYSQLENQQVQSKWKNFIDIFKGFKINITDLFYFFLSEQETAKNSKNSFDFLDKLKDRFNFLENDYEMEKKNFSTFCQTCFKDLDISYKLIDLPNILILSTKNVKGFKINLDEKLNFEKFRNLNRQENTFEFSTKTLNKFPSQENLQNSNQSLNYQLQSFNILENGQFFTYFKNDQSQWFKISQNAFQKIDNKEFQKITQSLQNLNFCVYQKIIQRNQKVDFINQNEEKPFFVPRLLIQSLQKQQKNTQALAKSFFCDHLKLKTCYRELFGKFQMNQEILNKNDEDQKIWNLISKIKNKNTTLLNYISESEIVNFQNLKSLFEKNNQIVNLGIFQKPQKCEDCYQLIIKDQIKRIILKAILHESQKTLKHNITKYYIEKNWLIDFFQFLNAYRNLPKNSSIQLQKFFNRKINQDSEQLKYCPYYTKDLYLVSEDCIKILLDLFGGNLIYSKSFCQPIQTKKFTFRQSTQKIELEILLKILKSQNFSWCTKNKPLIEKLLKIEEILNPLLNLQFSQFNVLNSDCSQKDQKLLKSYFQNSNPKQNVISQLIALIPSEFVLQIDIPQKRDSLMELFSIVDSEELEFLNESKKKLNQFSQKQKNLIASSSQKQRSSAKQEINSFRIGDSQTQQVSLNKIETSMESSDELSDENYPINTLCNSEHQEYSNSKELALICGAKPQPFIQNNVLITIEQSAEQSKKFQQVFESLQLNPNQIIKNKFQNQNASIFARNQGILITNEQSTERSHFSKNSKDFNKKIQSAELTAFANTIQLIEKAPQNFEKYLSLTKYVKTTNTIQSFLLVIKNKNKTAKKKFGTPVYIKDQENVVRINFSTHQKFSQTEKIKKISLKDF